MSGAGVEACVADAVADHDRQGGLHPDDVHRLVSQHRLEPSEARQVFESLVDLGIEIDSISTAAATDDLEKIEPAATGSAVGDSFGVFLREAARVPLLSAEQEVALAQRIELGARAQRELEATSNLVEPLATVKMRRLREAVKDGRQARESMIAANVRLVVSIARRHQNQGLELSDVVQEGMFGLIRAVDKFDYTKGFKLSTYATWWIRQSIDRGLADKGRLIRLPVHVIEDVRKVVGVRRRLEAALGRIPTTVELASELGMAEGKVQAIADYMRLPVSLDAPLPGADIGIGEWLTADGYDVEHEVIETLDRELVAHALDLLDHHLADTTKGSMRFGARMLRLRFGFEDGQEWTLDSIGERYNVTRERVRQIEGKLLKGEYLRHALVGDQSGGTGA